MEKVKIKKGNNFSPFTESFEGEIGVLKKNLKGKGYQILIKDTLLCFLKEDEFEFVYSYKQILKDMKRGFIVEWENTDRNWAAHQGLGEYNEFYSYFFEVEKNRIKNVHVIENYDKTWAAGESDVDYGQIGNYSLDIDEKFQIKIPQNIPVFRGKKYYKFWNNSTGYFSEVLLGKIRRNIPWEFVNNLHILANREKKYFQSLKISFSLFDDLHKDKEYKFLRPYFVDLAQKVIIQQGGIFSNEGLLSVQQVKECDSWNRGWVTLIAPREEIPNENNITVGFGYLWYDIKRYKEICNTIFFYEGNFETIKT